ncbi:hypothetical protein EI555_016354 [Monodon monoceros]|uniref:BET1 homolog n=1 Tax=Monodon monoceros TaxID=40151 RepID=A0A4U1EU01_MONMO|nr:hypothetical protein EI555_016354 [Monodon monoceros]
MKRWSHGAPLHSGWDIDFVLSLVYWLSFTQIFLPGWFIYFVDKFEFDTTKFEPEIISYTTIYGSNQISTTLYNGLEIYCEALTVPITDTHATYGFTWLSQMALCLHLLNGKWKFVMGTLGKWKSFSHLVEFTSKVLTLTLPNIKTRTAKRFATRIKLEGQRDMGPRLSFWNSYRNPVFKEKSKVGEGVPPGNYGNYGYPNSGYSACEEENERLTESLRNKVTAIKSLSIEIGHEVKHQNKLLAEMDSQFDSTTGFLAIVTHMFFLPYDLRGKLSAVLSKIMLSCASTTFYLRY